MSIALPLAFDMPVIELKRRALSKNASAIAGGDVALELSGEVLPTTDTPPYAWVIEWNRYFAPRTLNRIDVPAAPVKLNRSRSVATSIAHPSVLSP